ncbi:Glutamate--tRNA ligase 1 [Luteitalea pratensis]|uniref:Glutamate--tRNA ligase n=1 Tax=Luteitalea pratensis TaxID=1855912 RepID=A0A143PV41_LUTPR|nr:glutamate--tRNA ligase [Luteitalea pratensis]AMY11649.1 Glutamate--tRNA ligase 1 [Luteitalea pratensis]
MRVRFAPSPTGHLHVGNARTALFNWLLARGQGGTLVLRLEDTDEARSTVASAEGILEDLHWLGIDWHEGPDVGGEFGPYRQTQRLAVYRAYADRLRDAGHAYYCFCSPADLEAARDVAVREGRTPQYAGICRHLDPVASRARVDAGEPAALRFRVPAEIAVTFTDVVRGPITTDIAMIGDFVLLRQNGLPAYNFAVVVDDVAMRISLVVRGEDHVPNTPRQCLIYRALGETPPQFAHLSLVLGPDHAPLSKRHGASSVAEFRARGILPEALRNYLVLLGWSPGNDEEILPIEELARRFRVEDVTRSAGVFDPDKLAWMNRHYLKEAEPTRIAALLVPHLQDAGVLSASMPGDDRLLSFLTACVPLIAGTVDRLADAPERLRPVFEMPRAGAVLEHFGAEEAAAADAGRAVVVAFAQELSARPRLTRETFRDAAQQVRQRTGQKGRALFHPIRLALTGADSGPELDLLVPAIDAGADVPRDAGLAPIVGCRERAAICAAAILGS